jgi:hypothetical protein
VFVGVYVGVVVISILGVKDCVLVGVGVLDEVFDIVGVAVLDGGILVGFGVGVPVGVLVGKDSVIVAVLVVIIYHIGLFVGVGVFVLLDVGVLVCVKV